MIESQAATKVGSSKKSKRDDAPRFLVWSILAGAMVMTVLPLIWMVFVAFQRGRAIISPGLAYEFTLANFAEILNPQLSFVPQIVNSVILVVTVTAICIGLSSMASYSLSQLNWSPKTVIAFIVGAAVLQLVPPMTLVPGLFVTLQLFGLTGSLSGLIILNVIFNLPFAILMLKFYFDSIPSELREAAYIDGASEFTTFIRIMLPLAGPGLAAVSIFIGIQVWNEFLFGLLFTQGGSAPITVGIAGLVQPQEIKWGAMAAAGTLTALPVILMAVVANRQIVAGLTRGAVKA